jgi:hypothetical protein
MASISTLVDRVKIVVQTSGTGPFQLGPAVVAYRGTEALLDGATYSYAVENGAQYEVGTGQYIQASGVLTRVPQISSAGGSVISFPANIELNFTALAADIVATGAAFPIVDSSGDDPDVAISQRAAGAAIEQVLTGQTRWSLPDEANGDIVPSSGSGLPYLSAGVFKIA